MRGLSLVVASRGHSSSRCVGLSLLRPLLLRSTGSRRAGSVVVAHRPSCSAACGIFPDQGSYPCSLHRQADSQPLRHQGSPLNSSFERHGILRRFVKREKLFQMLIICNWNISFFIFFSVISLLIRSYPDSPIFNQFFPV